MISLPSLSDLWVARQVLVNDRLSRQEVWGWENDGPAPGLDEHRARIAAIDVLLLQQSFSLTDLFVGTPDQQEPEIAARRSVTHT